MARKKIAVIGGGNVGQTCAHVAAIKNLGDVVITDIVEGMPQGKALDLMECRSFSGIDVDIMGTTKYDDIAGSDLVIVTAGMARKPGMTREDLLDANIKIVKPVAEAIKKFAPDSIVLVVSNPLDSMVYLTASVTGFPKNRVIGSAGVLDSARFACFIAMELKVSPRDVQTLVLGGHGDDMVPLVRRAQVNGVPVENLIPPDRLAALVDRTRKAGGEIVALLKTGSAYFSPGSATVTMAEAILNDQRRVMPCSVWCEKEYGVGGYFMGVPAVLGATGVQKVVEIDLNAEEKAAFQKSLDSVKKTVQEMKGKGF
ncbi:MAG: malate dehydrogenase [Proteobacteria bacterium]|nr:malate dehydrogenase [Pseudomonadota bacterium]